MSRDSTTAGVDWLGLNGKRAVVTGPAKGMGPVIVRALAEQGVDLALVSRDLKSLVEFADTVREEFGTRAIAYACDVTQSGQVDDTIKAVLIDMNGEIDILVNIAGGTGPLETTTWDTTPDAFSDVVTVNMHGCFHTMKAVLPTMIQRRYGKIVNIGGTFGLRGRALRMAYSASKWGLRGITKSAALEAGTYNINVNCVCPGMVDGPRFSRVTDARSKRLGIDVDEARGQFASEYALKRITAAEDIANAVLFLVSDRSRNVTGQDLAVDGGWVI